MRENIEKKVAGLLNKGRAAVDAGRREKAYTAITEAMVLLKKNDLQLDGKALDFCSGLLVSDLISERFSMAKGACSFTVASRF